MKIQTVRPAPDRVGSSRPDTPGCHQLLFFNVFGPSDTGIAFSEYPFATLSGNLPNGRLFTLSDVNAVPLTLPPLSTPTTLLFNNDWNMLIMIGTCLINVCKCSSIVRYSLMETNRILVADFSTTI